MPLDIVFSRPQKLVSTKTLLFKHYYRRQGKRGVFCSQYFGIWGGVFCLYFARFESLVLRKARSPTEGVADRFDRILFSEGLALSTPKRKGLLATPKFFHDNFSKPFQKHRGDKRVSPLFNSQCSCFGQRTKFPWRH